MDTFCCGIRVFLIWVFRYGADQSKTQVYILWIVSTCRLVLHQNDKLTSQFFSSTMTCEASVMNMRHTRITSGSRRVPHRSHRVMNLHVLTHKISCPSIEYLCSVFRTVEVYYCLCSGAEAAAASLPEFVALYFGVLHCHWSPIASTMAAKFPLPNYTTY